MGLIAFLQRGRERRRIARAFSAYVDPAIVNQLLDGTIPPPAPPVPQAIDFVLMLVRDEVLAHVPPVLAEVDRLTRAHDGFSQIPDGPLVFVTFGVPVANAGAAAHRRACAAALSEALGDRVKIMHGSGVGMAGSVVGAGVTYGIVVRGFSGLLAALTALPFGEVREINP